MKAFETFTGTMMALERANIDTDAIIPKEYLKSIKRTGFGDALFSDWRYENGEGTPEIADFKMNLTPYRNSEILVAGNNFGCGSSREHAVWAVQQFGFKVVIACWQPADDGAQVPGFADIFRSNSGKNGLVLIQLSPEDTQQLAQLADTNTPMQTTVSLEEQTIICHAGGTDTKFSFEFEPALKERLILGLDEIALTMKLEESIAAFEAQQLKF